MPLLWLRDHCPCPKCLHPETRQRLSDTVAFDQALAAHRISIAANAPELEIEWAGGDAHVSTFRCGLAAPGRMPHARTGAGAFPLGTMRGWGVQHRMSPMKR